MAKPVKETPILFGEEARQFEVRMLHPKPLSKDDEGSDTRLLYFDLESFSAGDMFNTP